jgi:ATP-dependent DNA helicase RecG
VVALGAKLSAAVGGTAKALEEALGLRTVGDLLRHYPRKYVERGALTPFSELVVGEHATVFAEIDKVGGRQIRPKLHKSDVTIVDGEGGRMTLAIFNRRFVVERDLRPGRKAYFSGKVERFNNKIQLANPEYQLVDDEAGVVAEEFAGALVPIYPAAAKAGSPMIARSVRMALDMVDLGADPLPPDLRDRHALLGLERALRGIHAPSGWPEVTASRKRLTWDEAFVLQVVLAQRRAAAQALAGTPRAGRTGGLLDAFDAQTPFTLTAGQAEVGGTLSEELARTAPMYRLLQGEVGSGKTLVALRAMLQVVDSGGQAALLAPTEVLAQQHARSLRAMLGPLAEAGELGAADVATRVALLTGSQGAAARRTALAEAASGEAGIVVGTHALLSEGVGFADLGLVVVDEQHRFGVEQRDALRAKGSTPPHVLVMTATPIPRTIAMTVYGDLEVSTLTELPQGRSPITTHVIPASGRALERTWEKVREEVAAGRQAFVVCPRIGDADGPAEVDDEGRRPAAAVEEVLPLLADGPLTGLRVAPLHGRLAPEAKDDAMGRFTRGELDVLVATTVIEVGVDVPNATVMVVLDADRFGVSQLHQLRGRIGRGSAPGLCVLVTEVDAESPSGERLRAVAGTNDGFELSRVDLQQRREGDVLGASQSGGRSSLRMLRLADHEELILEARAEAVQVVAQDPGLDRHPALKQAVVDVLDEERAEFLAKA